MSRRLINIAVSILIIAATPIYLAGMLLLFCAAVIAHAIRWFSRRLLGRHRVAKLMRLHKLGR